MNTRVCQRDAVMEWNKDHFDFCRVSDLALHVDILQQKIRTIIFIFLRPGILPPLLIYYRHHSLFPARTKDIHERERKYDVKDDILCIEQPDQRDGYINVRS